MGNNCRGCMGNNCRGSVGNCMSCIAKVDVSHTGCVHMDSALNYSGCRGNHSRGNHSRGSSKSCVSSATKVDMAVPCSVHMNSRGSMDSRMACDKCRGLGQDLSDWLDKCRGCMDSGVGGSQVDVVVVYGRG